MLLRRRLNDLNSSHIPLRLVSKVQMSNMSLPKHRHYRLINTCMKFIRAAVVNLGDVLGLLENLKKRPPK
jgi:hypothetical protein